MYDTSPADNGDGKQEEEGEDMPDGGPDEGEPPDINNKPVPEKSSETVDVRNDSMVASKTTSDSSEMPVDVFGDYLLLEKLIHERETENLVAPASGKVETHSKNN